MKKIITLTLIFVFIFPVKVKSNSFDINTSQLFIALQKQYSKQYDTVRIMSYNLLSDELGFDGLPVESRKEGAIHLINSVNPDILGLQEMNFHWFSSLKAETCLEYVHPLCYMLSRSMTTLMYNPKRLKLLEAGAQAFRYSTNPRLRNYTWGLFEDKNNRIIFLAVNTHLNLYEQATPYPILQATELITFCKQAEEKYKCPVFITGDFNSKVRSKSSTDSAVSEYISLFYENSQANTFNGTYGADKSLSAPTNDYIFYSGSCDILSFNLLSQPELSVLSDHYPIFADVKINTS